MSLLRLGLLSLACSVPLGAQTTPGNAQCLPLSYFDGPLELVLPPDWYSGDTHDHIQLCNGSLLATEDVWEKMILSGLDVSCVAIWDGIDSQNPYTQQVCRVTGEVVPSPPGIFVQYGIEDSGLDAGRWGHLAVMGVGSDEARIAVASFDAGDCYEDEAGLGLGCPGGDGTGTFNAPVADHFGKNADAVRGYCHQAWPTGVQIAAPQGYDWYSNLVLTGMSDDFVCLDPSDNLTLPILDALSRPEVLPPLAALDVALGKVEYLETVDMENDYSGYTSLPARWYGMYYKLLSAGLRVSPAAGSDVDCANITGRTSLPRTHVRVEGPLSFGSWIEGLAEGRSTLAMGDDLFLDLQVDGQEIGSQVEVFSPANQVTITATLLASCAVDDRIEIVRNGKVIADVDVMLPAGGGTASLTLPAQELDESSWLAARLCSNRAHTAATYVSVDSRAIAGCEEAEYWMAWCDVLTRTILMFPSTFQCQVAEVLDHIDVSRKAFKALRDYASGFDPDWSVQRFGESTSACRGPIAIGVTGPVVSGQPFTLTCLNAPPRSSGLAFLCDRSTPVVLGQGLTLYIDPQAPLATFVLADTGPNGYANTVVPGNLPLLPGMTLYAQYLWNNTAECSPGASFSASDALRITVQ